MNNYSARVNMIKQQLRTGGVLNESILNLYEIVPRHEFVPEAFTHFAYTDMQIPLGHGQRMLTPLEEGTILQALNLKDTDCVLEVGTGSGFFTALLSKLCNKVISVDYFSEFTNQAARKLEHHNCTNVTLITGDACQGWLENAPYNVMVFTGALEQPTDTHFIQVLNGGKLFAITGKEPIMQAYVYQIESKKTIKQTLLFETLIPQLVDKLKPTKFVF